MIWLALIIIYVGLNALSAILASVRPHGKKSQTEIVLFIMTQGFLVFVLFRLLVWMF